MHFQGVKHLARMSVARAGTEWFRHGGIYMCTYIYIYIYMYIFICPRPKDPVENGFGSHMHEFYLMWKRVNVRSTQSGNTAIMTSYLLSKVLVNKRICSPCP